MRSLLPFWRDQRGQDLIEYTLLVAFVALASSALFLAVGGGSIPSIWSTTNDNLANAAAAAS